MKLALLLAAVDWRLGVLLRGDKGAGKTTAARALAELLPGPAPFVNLPVGATEDRLLGGLDVARALRGEPALKPGLLAEANGGVLYVDEVNLLPGHLGDALLDAAATGVHTVEREGFSASTPAQFVLLGSMNPEEGTLRPQLLDRFALAVDVTAPLEPAERQTIVERRLSFEREPELFSNAWAAEQARLSRQVAAARSALSSVAYTAARLAAVSEQICELGIRSLRADLAAVRAALALAALSGDEEMTEEHIRTVLPLVLAHRATQPRPRHPPSPPQPERQPAGDRTMPDEADTGKSGYERIFPVAPLSIELIEPLPRKQPATGSGAAATLIAAGPVIGSRPAQSPAELDLRASLSQSLRERGEYALSPATLHERIRSPRAGTRHLLLIDSSGSHAAQQRMRLVKGAALSLLRASFGREDEVAIIAFRGVQAQVLLEPTRLLEDAVTALEYLPTGGRTPLAHAFEAARPLITERTTLILFTDGRPNVALNGGDPEQEALALAASLECDSLVVDTADEANRTTLGGRLAATLRGRYVTLAECVSPAPAR